RWQHDLCGETSAWISGAADIQQGRPPEQGRDEEPGTATGAPGGLAQVVRYHRTTQGGRDHSPCRSRASPPPLPALKAFGHLSSMVFIFPCSPYPKNRLFGSVESCEIMAGSIVPSPGMIVLMDTATEPLDALIRSGARRLTGFRRRAFIAEVARELC